MKTVTAQQMRELDARTIDEAGISGEILMQRAGEGAAEEILLFIRRYHCTHVRRFVLFAGKGNNGGDAYVVARYLYRHTDIPVHLYAVCPVDELQGDARIHAERTPDDVPLSIIKTENGKLLSPLPLTAGDVIIDALLGTGIKGPLKPPYDAIISEINSSGLPVLSLDIPSGLNGDDGVVATEAVKADLTITMGLPKRGFLFGAGPECTGILKCVDIGIPQSFIDEIDSDIDMLFSCDIRNLRRRPVDSYKNRNGHVLVVGGSFKYHGAPLLSAEAAMRSGAGLVTLAVPESANIATPTMKSLIFRPIKDAGTGTFSSESIEELTELAKLADVIVLGPGLTMEPPVIDMLKSLLLLNTTIIIDADGLNIIAENISLLKNRRSETVLTPHTGELRRLTRKSITTLSDKMEAAVELAAETGSVVVAKGERTVIADENGDIIINSSGSPALATAGTGDVLTGIIAAFSQQGSNLFDMTASAVYIHGVCGEISEYGVRGTVADDIIDLIPEAMKQVSAFA